MRRKHTRWRLLPIAVLILTLSTSKTAAQNATDAGMVFDLPIKNPNPAFTDDKTAENTILCSKCSLEFGGKAYNKSELTNVSQYYVNLAPSLGCNLSDYDTLKTIDKPWQGDSEYEVFVLVKRGICNFSDRARHIAEINAKPEVYQGIRVSGVVHLSDGVITPSGQNKTLEQHLGVLVCTVDDSYYEKLMPTHDVNKFYPFAYYKFRREEFPYKEGWTNYVETAVIWIIAMVSMICAAKYVSAIETHKRKRRSSNGRTTDDNGQEKVELIENNEDEEITVMKTVFMVAYASVFLVTLYFLYKYLVWIMLGMFVLMSAATFSLLLTNLAVMYAPKLLGADQPGIDCGKCGTCSIFDFLTLGTGFAVGLVWFIFRHSDWSWTLQDLMGFTFCISIPSQLKVTNLKTVTILFASFFVYDVFMVFGTRLLTPNGDSVMVEVATGAGTGEMIPMLFKVPKFSLTTYLKSCTDLGYSMLGFGDIIVPAIMTCLCVRFDILCPVGRRRMWKQYTFWAIVSYGFSLLVCFVALYLMKEGQPALLYICPIMVGAVCTLAALRGEFKIFWNKGLKLNDHSHRSRFSSWQVCAETGEDVPFNASSSSSRHVSTD